MAKVDSNPLLRAPQAPVEAPSSELEAMMEKLAKMSNYNLLPFLNRNVPTEVPAFHKHFNIVFSKDDFDVQNYAKLMWIGLAEWRLAQPKSFSYFYFLALHLFETEERVNPADTTIVRNIWVYNRSQLAEKFAHYASRDCVLPAADDLWLRLFQHIFLNAPQIRVLPSRSQWKISLPLLYLLVEVIQPPVHFEHLFNVLWDAISNNPTLKDDQQKWYQSDKIRQVLLMYARQYRHASPNIQHTFRVQLSKLHRKAKRTKQDKLAACIEHYISTSQ